MSAINTIKAFRAGAVVEQPVLLEALDIVIEQAERANDLNVKYENGLLQYHLVKDAKEILERENNLLREALKEISEMYSDGKSPVLDHWGMLNVARQALEIRHE